MSSGNLDIQLCLEACRLLFEKQLYEKCVTLLQRPLENFNEATPGYNEVLSKLFTIAGLLDVDEMEKIVKTALPYGIRLTRLNFTIISGESGWTCPKTAYRGYPGFHLESSGRSI